MNALPPSQSDAWTRLSRTIGRVFGVSLRLVFVVVLAVGLGLGVYFGLPALYNNLIKPLQDSATQVSILADRVENLRASVDQSQAAQDARLTVLETGGDAQRERVAAAEAGLSEVEKAVADEATARDRLETDLSKTATDAKSLASELDALQKQLEVLSANAENNAAERATLTSQVALLRLRGDLLQTRLQLVAENLGEVRLGLSAAIAGMRALTETLDALPADTRAALTSRLLAAESLIQRQPAAALREVEAVWDQLDGAVSPSGEAAP